MPLRLRADETFVSTTNVSVGMPLLDATDVENLSGTGNKAFGSIEPGPSMKIAWCKRAAAKAFMALVIAGRNYLCIRMELDGL